ncbi:MAG TPA: alpha/beta fold hydrolase [Acidimicrobiales bacterium]|nr:alpha/beta fold hydrolase [Acidimicrobiales bacterium]
MSLQRQLLTTPDGRVLEVASAGDPSGPTVVVHHGSPGTATILDVFAAAAARDGWFAIALTRPGYAASSRAEGRTISSVVGDVRVALDALGRVAYVAVGWSGGGPHSLACAALDAPRCVGAWSIAGVVPIDVDFDWTAGMAPENVEEFSLALEGGPQYQEHMVAAGAQFATATPENVIEIFGGLLSPVDREALADDRARAALARACADAFSTGWHGFFDDDRAFLSPWGFDVQDIAVPVAVWYGDQDNMVPPTHGAWLASHIPGAREVHLASEGHVSLVSRHLDRLSAEILDLWRGEDRS